MIRSLCNQTGDQTRALCPQEHSTTNWCGPCDGSYRRSFTGRQDRIDCNEHRLQSSHPSPQYLRISTIPERAILSIRAKKHHYVPQCLQRRFLSDDGFLFYAKKLPTGKFADIQATNTQHAFVERNLYTTSSDDGLSDIYERKYYHRLDTTLGLILKETEEIFEQDHVPIFEGKRLQGLRRLFMDLVRRTPDIHHKVLGTDDEIGKQFVDEIINDNSEELEPLKSGLLSLSIQEIRQHGRDIRMSATTGSFEPENLAILDQLDSVWAVTERNASFILPSTIVYRVGNGGPNALVNPNFEMWLPVHPQRALVLLRNKDGRIPVLNKITNLTVRSVNEFAVRDCRAVASHSARLLSSLLGQNVNNVMERARNQRKSAKKQHQTKD